MDEYEEELFEGENSTLVRERFDSAVSVSSPDISPERETFRERITKVNEPS